MIEKLIVFGPEGRSCQLKEETLYNVFNFLNHPFMEATGAACPKLQEAEHSIADLLFGCLEAEAVSVKELFRGRRLPQRKGKDSSKEQSDQHE
jgi:hypothetical protein